MPSRTRLPWIARTVTSRLQWGTRMRSPTRRLRTSMAVPPCVSARRAAGLDPAVWAAGLLTETGRAAQTARRFSHHAVGKWSRKGSSTDVQKFIVVHQHQAQIRQRPRGGADLPGLQVALVTDQPVQVLVPLILLAGLLLDHASL